MAVGSNYNEILPILNPCKWLWLASLRPSRKEGINVGLRMPKDSRLGAKGRDKRDICKVRERDRRTPRSSAGSGIVPVEVGAKAEFGLASNEV